MRDAISVVFCGFGRAYRIYPKTFVLPAIGTEVHTPDFSGKVERCDIRYREDRDVTYQSVRIYVK